MARGARGLLLAECRFIQVLHFALTWPFGLREVYEEGLFDFVLLLPLIKSISQDDAALPFHHGVLQGDIQT